MNLANGNKALQGAMERARSLPALDPRRSSLLRGRRVGERRRPQELGQLRRLRGPGPLERPDVMRGRQRPLIFFCVYVVFA